MADTTQTYRRGFFQLNGLNLERYLGLAVAVAAMIATVAVFGSFAALWSDTKQVLGMLYMLAVVVAS